MSSPLVLDMCAVQHAGKYDKSWKQKLDLGKKPYLIRKRNVKYLHLISYWFDSRNLILSFEGWISLKNVYSHLSPKIICRTSNVCLSRCNNYKITNFLYKPWLLTRLQNYQFLFCRFYKMTELEVLFVKFCIRVFFGKMF